MQCNSSYFSDWNLRCENLPWSSSKANFEDLKLIKSKGKHVIFFIKYTFIGFFSSAFCVERNTLKMINASCTILLNVSATNIYSWKKENGYLKIEDKELTVFLSEWIKYWFSLIKEVFKCMHSHLELNPVLYFSTLVNVLSLIFRVFQRKYHKRIKVRSINSSKKKWKKLWIQASSQLAAKWSLF